MKDYVSFLESKAPRVNAIGKEPMPVNSILFDWQSDIVKWGIKRGCAAFFEDCGLGKSFQQIEWIRQMITRRGLIVCPLSVAEQTIAEGVKLGVTVTYKLEPDESEGIWITNYDRLHKFDPALFDAIVLDESSILKSLDGKTRTMLLEKYSSIPYRLCCTATPAPNDLTELTNHAEFLGVMSRQEMLATFFVHDSEDSGDRGWRLKKHARKDFWQWVAQWAVYIRKPSDLGYDDGDFILPPLTIEEKIVESNFIQEGHLFPGLSGGVSGRAKARRATLDTRVEFASEFLKHAEGQWLVWCGLNDEGQFLARALGDRAILIEGSTSNQKEREGIRRFLHDLCICQLSTNANNDKPAACGNMNTQKIEGENIANRKKRKTVAKASAEIQKKTNSTCETTISQTSPSTSERERSKMQSTLDDGNVIGLTLNSGTRKNLQQENIKQATPSSESASDLSNTEFRFQTLSEYSNFRTDNAPSVGTPTDQIQQFSRSLTTAIRPETSEVSCADAAIMDSDSSRIVRKGLSVQPCTCGNPSNNTILISKASMFGFGLNFQHCHNILYLGLDDSFEKWYQSVRRCWRYGQKHPVNVVVVTSDAESQIVENVKRKERQADEMAAGIVDAMREAQIESVHGNLSRKDIYKMETVETDRYKLMLGDCVERIKEIPDKSIGMSIFSPPFAKLYTYSPSDRDMGNCKNDDQFFEHFAFLIPEILRVTKPGRRCCVHVQQLALTVVSDGVSGMKDFRADVVRAFVAAGWIYDGEVVIGKNPQAQAIRTKAKSLMFVQKNKDSASSRPAMADYILPFRAPGVNDEPIVQGVNKGVTNEDWIKFAYPIWYDIDESDTLNGRVARENDDERHICPLQLETIRRCIRLWSNPGDEVLSTFMGIGSEGYVAIEQERRFVGIELKESYFKQAVKYVSESVKQESLFDLIESESEEIAA